MTDLNEPKSIATPLPITESASNSSHAVSQTLEAVLATALRPSLDQFFTNVEANPTVVNVGAQAQAVLPNMIAAVPAAEGAGLKSIFAALHTAVDHALTVTVPAAQAAQTGATAATSAVPSESTTTASGNETIAGN